MKQKEEENLKQQLQGITHLYIYISNINTKFITKRP